MREFSQVLGDQQVEGHMTRLRNLALGGLAALAISGAASTAFAVEPVDFQNRLNGATIGLPLGAAAPPGLYTGLETAYLGFDGNANGNQGTGHIHAIAQAVPLLWSTGWTFLGANYSVAAVAAFYWAGITPDNVFNNGLALADAASLGSVMVVANPTWTPINLSWNLQNGWFIDLAFNFMAPIGTHLRDATNPDYWTLEPALAISYINSMWNASANMFFDINTNSRGNMGLGLVGTPGAVGFHDGDAFYLDAHALYKIGKWSIGPVGYTELQVQNDSPGSGFTCATSGVPCGTWETVGLGGLVGYDFGPVDLQVWVTDNVYKHDAIDGLNVWTRLGFRLWAPEAPKPLVAKN
jgi:hypothetical protein